ncbi:hypothetical protein H4S08_001990 [Coemansia sp. RSA 1365]|nr:hypothetical protein H4S08_001990 [Coemansia sp. RSA 1365]
MAPHFFPPMWEQRRICIARTLYTQRVQSVVEVGCGEGNVLAFLASSTDDDEHPITRLVGIDIDENALSMAREQLQPSAAERRDLRVDPLCIELYHGNAMVPIYGLQSDAVVCTEVLEHVSEQKGVQRLTRAVLGGYRPRIAVFTTPNAEFNINFPALCYGSPEARFRDADHKFEWTRAQFSTWAHSAARDFGYKVTLSGIGMTMRNPTEDFVDCGGCSQMAVFVKLDGVSQESDTARESKLGREESVEESEGDEEPETEENSKGPPSLFAVIDYPNFAEPPMDTPALQNLVRQTALKIADSSQTFQAEELWAVLEIRQQFKRRRALLEWLTESEHVDAPKSLQTPSAFTIRS